MQLMQPSLLMFEPAAGAIYGGYDFRLRDLKKSTFFRLTVTQSQAFAFRNGTTIAIFQQPPPGSSMLRETP